MKKLSEFIKDNPSYFSNQQNAYRLLHQLLDVLAKMHSKGELHLGLSSETIFISGEDYNENPSNYNWYSIQFKKPLAIGDVNGDKSITIADVTALVNIILGKAQN